MPELKESPLSQIAVAGVILLKKAFLHTFGYAAACTTVRSLKAFVQGG